jgi:hypothetical protein
VLFFVNVASHREGSGLRKCDECKNFTLAAPRGGPKWQQSPPQGNLAPVYRIVKAGEIFYP